MPAVKERIAAGYNQSIHISSVVVVVPRLHQLVSIVALFFPTQSCCWVTADWGMRRAASFRFCTRAEDLNAGGHYKAPLIICLIGVTDPLLLMCSNQRLWFQIFDSSSPSNWGPSSNELRLRCLYSMKFRCDSIMTWLRGISLRHWFFLSLGILSAPGWNRAGLLEEFGQTGQTDVG